MGERYYAVPRRRLPAGGAATRRRAIRDTAGVESRPAWLADVQVCPSILAADFGAFRSNVQELLDAGARTFHVDVMDGQFVPVLTFGTGVVAASRMSCTTPAGRSTVHIMVERPDRFVDDFAKAGADSYAVHVEAGPHLHYWLERIREAGMRAGRDAQPRRRRSRG